MCPHRQERSHETVRLCVCRSIGQVGLKGGNSANKPVITFFFQRLEFFTAASQTKREVCAYNYYSQLTVKQRCSL